MAQHLIGNKATNVALATFLSLFATSGPQQLVAPHVEHQNIIHLKRG